MAAPSLFGAVLLVRHPWFVRVFLLGSTREGASFVSSLSLVFLKVGDLISLEQLLGSHFEESALVLRPPSKHRETMSVDMRAVGASSAMPPSPFEIEW